MNQTTVATQEEIQQRTKQLAQAYASIFAERRRKATEEVRKAKELLESLNQEEKVFEMTMKSYDSFKASLTDDIREQEALLKNEKGTIYRLQRNLVIASGTQNGKTREIIDIVKNSGPNSLCILSCDNKKDQLAQLTTRLANCDVFPMTCEDFQISKSTTLTDASITDASLKKIKTKFNKNKRLVIVMLNNNSQCSKVKTFTTSILKDSYFGITRFHMIHDEADLVNKADRNTTVLEEEKSAKIQKEWTSFFEALKPFTDLKYFKRIWVSATPENCSLIKDVKAKDVFVLPRNIDYRDKIKFSEWREEPDSIYREISRIRRQKSREIILYCAEYTNAKQQEASESLFETYNCPVITYNCDGIFSYSPSHKSVSKYKMSSINEVIESVPVEYDGPIIIVGGALLSRGISFVGTSKIRPRTATVMFYLGSDSSNAVAIAQRVGRITGTSRPDINTRRLYTRREIFDCYTNYLKNQETIYEILKRPENQELLVADILETEQSSLIKLGRNLDRPTLKKTNKSYDDACVIEPGEVKTSHVEESDGTIMENHVKRWTNPSVNTDISKVFKAMYSNELYRILSSEISKYIKDTGAVGAMTNKYANNWGSVFSKDSKFHYVKPEAVAFAKSLTKN